MRKLQLSNGEWIRVGCRHDVTPSNDVPWNVLRHMPIDCKEVRVTEAFIKKGERNPDPGNEEVPYIEVTAFCSPGDNFSRKLGRKVAAGKLLEQMRIKTPTNRKEYQQWLEGKKDRRAVFLAINPEYTTKQRKEKKDGTS